jgi:WD40 repeat protein
MATIPTLIDESGISSCKLSKNSIATSLHVDAKLIAVTLNNGSIHLFEPDGKHITELKVDKPVCLWSLAVKGTALIAGGIDGNLQLWDLASRYENSSRSCLKVKLNKNVC